MCVIGLGKLGYPMAEFLSSSGYSINCYDKDEKHVLNLQNKKPFLEFEHGLDAYKSNGNDLNYFLDIQDALNGTEMAFITVPTPSKSDGLFSNDFILSALEEISKFIKMKVDAKKPYAININSTVMPGSVRGDFIPFLEKKGLIYNSDFSFIYNPYFVALGDVIKGLERPDLVLIGVEDNYTKKLIKKLYNIIYKDKELIFLNFKEAELSKLLVNSFLTLKISYSNMVKDLTILDSTIDISKILNAVGSDSRVGKKFLKPGGPFSGPCLPRDTIALDSFSNQNNFENFLAQSVIATNKFSLDLLRLELNKIKDNNFKSLVFCGVGYKSHTPSLEETFIIDLMKYAESIGLKVYFYDSYINEKINIGQRISEDDIEKYSNLLFLPYVDIKFNKFAASNFFVLDIWHQISGENVFRTFNNFNIINKETNIYKFKKI